MGWAAGRCARRRPVGLRRRRALRRGGHRSGCEGRAADRRPALPMLGQHNVQNALAAGGRGRRDGYLAEDRIRAAFAGFGGVKRRFTETGVGRRHHRHRRLRAPPGGDRRRACGRARRHPGGASSPWCSRTATPACATCSRTSAPASTTPTRWSSPTSIPPAKRRSRACDRDALVEGLRARGHRHVVALPAPEAGWPDRRCASSPAPATWWSASAPATSPPGRGRLPAQTGAPRSADGAAVAGRVGREMVLDGGGAGLRRLMRLARLPRCAAADSVAVDLRGDHLVPRRRPGRGRVPAQADRDDLIAFLRARPDDLPVTVIGVASNLLVRDGGIAGVVVRLGRGFAGIECGRRRRRACAAARPRSTSTSPSSPAPPASPDSSSWAGCPAPSAGPCA